MIVVNAGKVLEDVAFEEICMFPQEVLGSGSGCMCPFVFASGIRIKNKGPLINGFQQAYQSMMDHSIPKRSCGNDSFLGFKNLEIAIGIWFPMVCGEFLPEQEELSLEVKGKFLGVLSVGAGSHGLSKCPV